MPFESPYQMPFGDIELLVDARSRISDRALWVRHRFQDGDRHCLVAALSLACGSRSYRIPNWTEKRLARVIAKQIASDAPFVTRCWLLPARMRLISLNDGPHTRHGDVIALFDRTIGYLTCIAPISVPA